MSRFNQPRDLFVSLIVIIWFAVSAANAQVANWSIELLNPNQLSSVVGESLVYNGRITNLTGSELILLGDNLSFSATSDSTTYSFGLSESYLALDGLIPITGYEGPIFYVQWLPSAPAGASGDGVLTLSAQMPADPQDLASNFTSGIATTAPEPSSIALFLSCTFALHVLAGGLRTRRKRTLRGE